MKVKKALSIALASAMLSTALFSATACKPGNPDVETGTKGKTVFGNTTLTDVVKNASKDVKIKLIRGKNILAEGTDTLAYSKSLQAGDIIEIESDYTYLNVKLFDNLGEQLVYAPSGQFTFQVPSTASQAFYQNGTFGGTSHTFTASVASDSEVAGERNLTVNPYDYMYVDEKNDQNATTMSADLLESAAVTSGQVVTYPHAYANRVTRNEAGFYARNAIDGSADSSSHGNYPYQSWGYNQKKDAEFVVYFGREVTLSKVAFVLRADFSGTKEHDTYWQDATVEFSDGTSETFNFEKTGSKQNFDLKQEVKTTSVRIKGMNEVQNSNSEMYAALTEFEAYGTDVVTENKVATKTTVTSAFGGKEQNKFSTKDYSYADIKATMDKANDWFINKTESENYQIPDYNGNAMSVKIDDSKWKDAVYYSGLSEAFFTTGDMNEYYFLRGVGNQFKYLNDNGTHTPHGDNYQIGETYLMLNDIKQTAYKMTDTLGNADYNLSRDMNDKTPPKVNGSEWIDPNRDWSHMGFWWCDSLYMAMNSYTLLSELTGESKYIEAAYEGYKYWKNELYNTTYNLWWRDSSQKSLTTNAVDSETGAKYPVFWSRGNAWVLAALAKQMMYLDPVEYADIYNVYKADFIELAESLAEYQREDGTWNASIVDESYYGGKETTGTCGFIYAYCVGLRMGLLDSSKYYPIVKKAYDCVVNNCMFESGQVGYMQTTGYQPQNYKSEEYSQYNTHEFGMGLFLLASAGMMSICSDYQAPSYVIPADPQAALLG